MVKPLSQMAVMAAVVAILAYVPLALVVALVLHLADIPPDLVLTLGGTVHAALGLMLGWLLVFAAACAYAAWLFPWGEERP